MPFEMFKKIVDDWNPCITEENWYIVLGGGEPTLHPDFWKLLGYALSKGHPWLATNGSNKEDALALCDLAKKGKVSATLSQDEWHDPIDRKVVEAFQDGLKLYEYDGYDCWLPPKNGRKYDLREIRMIKIPYKGGRATKMKETRKGCPCQGIQFRVNGHIYPCGCDDAPKIGTVDDGIIGLEYKYYDLFTGCYKRSNPVKEKG